MTRANNIRVRHAFYLALLRGLRVVWPILSGLLLVMGLLGIAIGEIEGWGPRHGVYFAFITGMTVGYGDFAPSNPMTRTLAIAIAILGLLVTGLVVAVATRALQIAIPLDEAMTTARRKEQHDDHHLHP